MKTSWLPYIHLAAWRERAGLTQEQMANRLGLTKSAISRWEGGKRQMDLGDLARVAELLDVEPVALFLAPEDYELAICIDRFAKLAKSWGGKRASALLDSLGAPPGRSTLD